MKKKIILCLIAIVALITTGCNKEDDGEKFASEYTKVDKYNVYVYKDIDEIINILEHGTGIVYLGFPECPWCQAYVPMLNEVADTEGLEKIYYYNILNDRKDNTKDYQTIVNILKDYLPYDEEGHKRIYVPAIIAITDGEIVGFDDETSYDTGEFDNPEDYWTEEKISALKIKLTEMVNKVIDNKCTDCNK